jgi:hypothetical protein
MRFIHSFCVPAPEMQCIATAGDPDPNKQPDHRSHPQGVNQ